MKIAILGSYNLADGYAGAAKGLESLGHEVVFEPLSKHKALMKNLEFQEWLKRFFNDFDGDLIILWRGESLKPIDYGIIRQARNQRPSMPPVLYYSWDDPFQLTEAEKVKTHIAVSLCDFAVTCCEESAKYYDNNDQLKVKGFWVLPGFDPEVHKPLENPTDEEVGKYGGDISFVATNCYKGNIFTTYPHFDRSIMVDRIIRDIEDVNLNLWGTGDEVPGWTNKEFGGGEAFRPYYRSWLPFEDSHKAFSLSRINLNSHIRPDGTKYLNERTFQVLGSGGLLLSDITHRIEEVFDLDKEIVVYSSYDDMIEKIKFLLSHEDERKEIANRGYEKALNTFTWKHWAQKIINVVSEG